MKKGRTVITLALVLKVFQLPTLPSVQVHTISQVGVAWHMRVSTKFLHDTEAQVPADRPARWVAYRFFGNYKVQK